MGPEIIAFLVAAPVLSAALVLLLRIAGDRDFAANRQARETDSVVRALKTAGQSLGLELVRDRRLRGARIQGSISGSHITVECAVRGFGPWLTTLRIQPQPPLPEDVWLQTHWRNRLSPTANDPASSEPDVDTGDSSFDALVAVGGRTAAVRASFTEPARRAIGALARKGGVRLRDGGFVHETIERVWDAGQLIALVREVLAAHAAIPRVSDVPAALAHTAQTDPVAGVRARCLATLLAEQPDPALTSAALESALSDESDAVRVVAATALGDRGVPVLREIAMASDSEDEPAARAIGVLGRRLSSSEASAVLDSAAATGRTPVALAAIESLGRAADAPACERLQALLRGDDADLAVAAAGALSFTTSDATEQALVQALASQHLAVRHAATRALGRVGHLASIAHLSALIEDSTPPAFAAALRQAIAAIQARIPSASPGQVSLAQGPSGDLSLAEHNAGGRLSIPDRDSS